MFGHAKGGKLGGGFKHFLFFIPIWGFMVHFYEHIFQMGGSTTNYSFDVSLVTSVQCSMMIMVGFPCILTV